MADSTHWLFGFLCVAALVIAIIAGVGYTQSKDLRNQTDTFGNAPSIQDNSTVTVVETTGKGGSAISSGLLIFFAVCIIILIGIAAAYALTRGQMRW